MSNTDKSRSIQLIQKLFNQTDLQESQQFKIYNTAHPSVMLFYQPTTEHKVPQLYEPGIVILLSGEKLIEIGQHSFQYDTHQALILTSVFPLECTTFATPENPLIGLYIKLDLNSVRGLIEELKQYPVDITAVQNITDAFGIQTLPLDEALHASIEQLLISLNDPVETALFGQERIRHIVFLLLRHPQSFALQQWSASDHLWNKLHQAITYMEQNYANAVNIEMLAQVSGMSVSSLHRVFKRYTSDAPMQYLKKLRLTMAKNLLQHGRQSVQQTAAAVGYESVSQFTREFKRYFGMTPKALRDS